VLEHLLLELLVVVGGEVAKHFVAQHAHASALEPLLQLECALRVLLVPVTIATLNYAPLFNVVLGCCSILLFKYVTFAAAKN
jgi:hypothetical protein